MSTVDKLNKALESKNAIKEVLETPYNVFRDYPDLIKKYVDNQPTKKVTDGTCNNAVDLPVKTIEVDGNSEQKTREGYNLLDFNVTQDGRVTVNQDGTITINGEGGFAIKFKEVEYKKGVTYKTKATLVSGTYTSSDPNHIGIMTPYGDDGWLANNIFRTYTSIGDKVRSGMWVGANCVFNNATFEIYSYEGTDDKNFEQYGASPSPDYPSKIEVIDGYNLFDKNNKTHTILNANGSATIVQDNFYSTNFISIDSNATYYKTFTGSIRVKFYDKNKTVISTSSVSDIANFNTEQIFTIPYVNAQYIRFSFDVNYQDTIMIVKSAAPQPYLPYGHIGLKQSGKNLLQYNINTQTENGVTLTDNNDGTYTLNGTATANGYFYPSADRYFKFPAGTYKFSSNKYENLVFAAYTDKSGTPIFWQSKDTTFTLLNDSNMFRMQISTIKDATYDNVVIKPMVRLATIEDDTFEPYHSPKLYPINLNGNSIAKVGDVKDLLRVYRNGDVEIEKKIGKVVLDGSENLEDGQRDGTDNTKLYRVNVRDIKLYSRVISNYFRYAYNWDINKNTIYIGGSRNIFIRVSKDEFSTREEFKNWLSQQYNAGTPVYADYILETPQTIKLPSIEPIELWEGTNIFKLISNLETDFEVEYVVDKESVLDEIQAAMLEAEIEI